VTTLSRVRVSEVRTSSAANGVIMSLQGAPLAVFSLHGLKPESQARLHIPARETGTGYRESYAVPARETLTRGVFDRRERLQVPAHYEPQGLFSKTSITLATASARSASSRSRCSAGIGQPFNS